MATKSYTSTESTSQTQTVTVNIPDLSSVDSVTTSTGNVTYSVSGKDVTLTLTNGTSTRSTNGTVLVPENRTGSATVTQKYTWSYAMGDGAWYGDSVQTSAPSTIKASDGIHDLSLQSITVTGYPSAPTSNGTSEGQTVTRNGTGYGNYSGYTNSTSTTYYYQYSGTITYTPTKNTYGTIELISANEQAINVRIKDLEYGSGYTQLVIQGPSGTVGVSIAGSDGVSYYTSTAVFQGLTPSTSYSFIGKFTHTGENPGTSSANFSTTAHVDAAPTLNFSNITVSNGGITCTFSGYDQDGLRASNTYSLQISTPDTLSYGPQVFYSNAAQNTNFTYTFTSDGLGNPLIGGKTYAVRIILYDAINQQTQDMKQIAYVNTAPTLNFSAIDGFNAVTCTFSGYDPEGLRAANTYGLQISGPGDVSYGAQVFYTSTVQNSSFTYSFTKDSVGNALLPGQTYTVRIILYDAQDATATATRSVAYTKSRPVNFAWTNAKSMGASYNLTTTEWNDFLNRVNDFREYKAKPAFSFNRTVTGSGAYVIPSANSFNSAVNAIIGAGAPTSPPNTVAGGETVIVTAYHFNQLRDSLNSIT